MRLLRRSLARRLPCRSPLPETWKPVGHVDQLEKLPELHFQLGGAVVEHLGVRVLQKKAKSFRLILDLIAQVPSQSEKR